MGPRLLGGLPPHYPLKIGLCCPHTGSRREKPAKAEPAGRGAGHLTDPNRTRSLDKRLLRGIDRAGRRGPKEVLAPAPCRYHPQRTTHRPR
jgi:hypothetical protein